MMTRETYEALPGLNFSGCKDLAISPLRYWYRWLRPDREPEEPTPEQRIGTALHCKVLTPELFDGQYCSVVNPADYPDALVTMDDLRRFAADSGISVKGCKLKAEMVIAVRSAAPKVPIWDAIADQHEKANAGKTAFTVEDWKRIAGMAQALADEPVFQKLLKPCERECVMLSPASGALGGEYADADVPLKGMIDGMSPGFILDLKTFATWKGRSVDDSIASAVMREKYYLQAVFYATLRGWPKWDGDYVTVWVESEPPYETRLRSIRPKTGGNANLLWERGRVEMRRLVRLYADCMKQFGTDKPWRWAQEITPLADEELPGLQWGIG